MNKEQLTHAFMAAAQIPAEEYKDCLWRWWQNPTNDRSLRLTEAGFRFLKERLGVEHYAMKVESSLGKNLGIYLKLDRLITSPFYIQNRSRIIFFGEQDKVMLELMDGDLDQYLKNLGT